MKKLSLKTEKNRENEKGAAMIMVLLISFLLLVASAGLLLEASMNTANITDATAEQQAYNAAESGIQSALNALRGNTVPSPLLNTSQSSTSYENQINFRHAVTLNSSNSPSDPSTRARLSRWMNYNYTPAGGTIPDRVTLGTGYAPETGNAFAVTVSDPDNTGGHLSYYTTGNIAGSGTTYMVAGATASDKVTISYSPVTYTNLNVSSGLINTNFGSFTISVSGAGATVPVDGLRFSINMKMTAPYSATRTIRGWIEKGTITSSSVGTVKILYDSQDFSLMGSLMSLTGGTAVYNTTTERYGYEITPTLGVNTIAAKVTAAEPVRVVVRSIGYGPRGAKKILEATVQKNFFNELLAPATLTLVGPSSGFNFNPGSSNVTTYSGDDVASNLLIPPIGTTNNSNLNVVQASVDGLPPHPFNGNVIGNPANVADELPDWLASTDNLDALVQSLRLVAQTSGSYYANGTAPNNWGNNATAKGLTFVEGNVEFTGDGGGIMVVTGQLTLNGKFDFNGVILVTGTGGVIRKGAGNGIIQGNIVVAGYNPANLAAGFSAPQYDLSGGGSSTLQYNSSSLANGLLAVSNFVIGVAEK